MTYLPFLISGLGIGAVYALSGVGLVVLFRATGVLNFAFGAVGALGAHVAWQVLEWRLPLAIAILAAVVVSALVSFLYGRLLAPLLSHRDTVVRAVGTLALALVLIAVMGVIWGEFPRRLQFPTDQMFLTVFGVRLTYTRILALLLAGLMVGAITALLSRTRLGLDMRALANDRDLSAILGVRIRHTETAAWVITGVFAGLAGLLLGDLVRLQGTFLTFLVVPAIAAAILGQLRSLWITATGGLAIGIAEAVLTPIAAISPYRAAAPFVIALIAVAILGSTAQAGLKDR
jgi:branched-chain amino acid transport system permease protein